MSLSVLGSIGLNRTSVGLKPDRFARAVHTLADGLNRTSVGLKLGLPRGEVEAAIVASIEPAWD